jgi:lantibiotic biosynthesis protein
LKTSIYQPLNFVLVRAPALPMRDYFALPAKLRENGPGSFLAANEDIHCALAAASPSLAKAMERASRRESSKREQAKLHAKLLQYVIRMSARPTPFGLFAGVALANWGAKTDLQLGAHRLTHTRPDMEWLIKFVTDVEAIPEIRKQLRVVANPASLVRCGRIYLEEQAPKGKTTNTRAVSIRATAVVLRVLEDVKRPVPYNDLFRAVLVTTPGATPAKVEKLLGDLCEQTFLLTDLRPPLTGSPARYVAEKLARLTDVPAARDALARLERICELAEAIDRPEPESTSLRTFAFQPDVISTQRFSRENACPFQVDMKWTLKGKDVNRSISDEATRAVELLLQMSPFPRGAPHLIAYRSAFVSRYGSGREVPVLELLDPEMGLGPPAAFAQAGISSGISQEFARKRRETLLELACTALHARQRVIELDEKTLADIRTSERLPDALPISLDLYASIVADSEADLDRGRFLMILGPNHGARAAGRNLGRFADVLGADAIAALEEVSRREREHAPEAIWAELVYLPRNLHSANVLVRPPVREYEISLGVSPGVNAARVIPANELVVGIREERFYLRWIRQSREVRVCAGHMLNTRQAPQLCRFLAELEQDGMAQFSPFDWGPATAFPFLPRVQAQRLVLRLAQWRIDSAVKIRNFSAEACFEAALRRWRDVWAVPRHVYVGVGDHRLLLDLEDANQIELLHGEIRRVGRKGGTEAITIQEALPGPEDLWLKGPDGLYVNELVVSLVRQARHTVLRPAALNASVAWPRRLRLPGSEWLFAKLYFPSSYQDEFIAGPLRDFVLGVFARSLATRWFFVRYSDPEPHLRVRFKGQPRCLLEELLPTLSAWAESLVERGLCHRLNLDTYEREVERYGGEAGLDIAEEIFCADSEATAELLALSTRRVLTLDRLALAVLSLDDLLGSFGLTEAERFEWCRNHVKSRDAGLLYRECKDALRKVLNEPSQGREARRVLATRHAAIEPLSLRLRSLAECSELGQSPKALFGIYLHLHCNRLLGIDHAAEREVMDLLRRTREGLAKAPGFAVPTREGIVPEPDRSDMPRIVGEPS